MNRDAIVTLYGLELRSLVRDRRTVILSVVIPVVVMPVMLFAQTAMERRRQERLLERTYTFAVTGAAAEEARAAVAAASERPLAEPPPDGGPADAAPRLKFVPLDSADPAADLDAGRIDVYVEGATGDRAREIAESERRTEARADGKDADAADTSAPSDAAPDLAFAVFYRSDVSASQTAARGLVALLDEERAARRAALLAERGFPVAPQGLAAVSVDDVADASQVAGARVAKFLTLLVVFLMLMGGATVASDIIAGEKERGTIETLLTTAAERADIVAAKLLAVLSVAVVIVVLEFSSVLVYARLRIVELPSDYGALLTPRTLAALVVLYLPVAALVSSVLLLVSGFAKTYKEAQLFFFPVMLLSAVPAGAAMLPGVGLRSIVALVPIAGASVAAREILVGHYDWPMLALTWAATALAAAALLARAARLLSSEELVTSADTSAAELTGGPELFPKRVLRWYALMWVTLFAISALEASLDIRWQVVINLIGVFLAGSLLMLRVYRLDPRDALALRMPRPIVFLAVLVGAPSGLLVGVGVARLASYVLPVPQEVMEQFGKEIFPAGVPIWQMLVFIAVLPGICEEIAFRGLLLYGLRRRFRPAVLCVVVGCVFGFFHFAIFRLASTAFLGMLLAAVTLMTGSIFPAMLWHALNNGISVVAALAFGVEIGSAWWHSAVAVVPLALSLWVIWRYRTPYPDLRPANEAPRRSTRSAADA